LTVCRNCLILAGMEKKADYTTKTKISVKEAAGLLGCSTRTVLRMIDRETLYGWKLDPQSKSVYSLWREDVEEIVKSRTE
jgi:excisionase family DNA binding protein